MIKDRMSYVVVTTHRNKTCIAERDVADLGRIATVRDIAEGQIEDVVQVLEINPIEGTCRDVSEDIAREVMNVWAIRGEPLSDREYDFVELHISVQAALSFRRAA